MKKLPPNNKPTDIKYIKGENKEFYRYFNYIGSIIGFNSTDTVTLTNLGKELIGNKFKGAYPCDRIPKLNSGESVIVNTDPHNKPGEHWTGLYCDGDDKYLFYDSFGGNYDEVIPKLKTYLKATDIFSTKTVRQNYSQYFCGASSLTWLVYLYNQPKPYMALVI